jgi:hypothetical protein
MASEGAAGGPAWTALVTGGTGGMGRVIDRPAPPTQSESGMCIKGKSIVFTGGNTSTGKATAPPLRRAVPM